jgi:hypothetical protein
MDINQIVNGIGELLSGALIVWLLNATKNDIKRKKKNGKN